MQRVIFVVFSRTRYLENNKIFKLYLESDQRETRRIGFLLEKDTSASAKIFGGLGSF